MTDTYTDYRSAQVALTVPSSWESLPQEGADLVVAAPADLPSGFRPNLVVTSIGSDEPVEVLSSVTIASAYDTEPTAHVVACDLWPHATVPGRRIEFGYESPLGWIYVTRWVFATGSAHVHLTASRAADDVVALDALFDGMALSATFPEGA